MWCARWMSSWSSFEGQVSCSRHTSCTAQQQTYEYIVRVQVEQWHVVCPLEQQLVNLWAIVDAHRREDPDYKVHLLARPAGSISVVFQD